MNKKNLWMVLAAGFTAACCLLYFMLKSSAGLDGFGQDSAFGTSEPENKRAALCRLYFSGKGEEFLKVEKRMLASGNGPCDLGKEIVTALIKGPESGLVKSLPQGTGLSAFYILEDGTAVVDITMDVRENHSGGSHSEYLTIYSVVNSLVLNVPDIKRVKILIGGRGALTLAGHIDLRFPLKANMLLVR